MKAKAEAEALPLDSEAGDHRKLPRPIRRVRKNARLEQIRRESPIFRTWDEVAAFMRVHLDTVMKMVEDGLPVYKTGVAKSSPIMAVRDELLAWQLTHAKKLKGYKPKRTKEEMRLGSIVREVCDEIDTMRRTAANAAVLPAFLTRIHRRLLEGLGEAK